MCGEAGEGSGTQRQGWEAGLTLSRHVDHVETTLP